MMVGSGEAVAEAVAEAFFDADQVDFKDHVGVGRDLFVRGTDGSKAGRGGTKDVGPFADRHGGEGGVETDDDLALAELDGVGGLGGAFDKLACGPAHLVADEDAVSLRGESVWVGTRDEDLFVSAESEFEFGRGFE